MSSLFRINSFRGKNGKDKRLRLERANTVATGLGQIRFFHDEVVDQSQIIARSSSGPTMKDDQDVDNEKFHHFCKGSIKRLKKAETKVSVAKQDMEQILSMAKSNVNSKAGNSQLDLESQNASLRLANDSRLAIEAQLEMRKIIRQFANLLQEEEDKVAIKADLLERRSSQIHFDYSVVSRKENPDDDDYDVDENDDRHQIIDDENVAFMTSPNNFSSDIKSTTTYSLE